MFTRSLMCMQNAEEIQLKLWEESITQSMHYQPLFIKSGLRKCQNPVILSKNIFSPSNFFMHIFNMPVTCMQNIQAIQEELITQSMHYQSLYSHLIVRITKGHNSANTSPLAPIFLSHVQFVMVQVWYKFYWNWTKGFEVITQNLICFIKN